jgi:hypothetical protein
MNSTFSVTRAGLPAVIAAAVLFGWTPSGGAEATGLLVSAYPLDEVSRTVAPRGRLRCPDVELVTYPGDVLRYHAATKVHPAFRDRLRMFEEVARDVAIEVYGRAPKTIRHMGTYNCRRIGGYPHLVSEHALGNGIDVAGFDFGPLPRGQALPEGVPAALRRGFKVRVLDHWGAERGAGALHSRYLRTLARRLIDRGDVFRVLLGPSYPGHRNHFHFDVAPYRLIDVFEAEAKEEDR